MDMATNVVDVVRRAAEASSAPTSITPIGGGGNNATNTFLNLISNPFSSQIQSTAVLASLISSLGLSLVIALLFCVLRPWSPVVYAPRARHADEKHAPPPVGKGLFAWVTPVIKTRELVLMDKIGLDATLFLRFASMCQNLFIVLSVLGCGIIIPVNLLGNRSMLNASGDGNAADGISNFMKLTPQFLPTNYYWAFVAAAYAFTLSVCGFLWFNYRAATNLRRAYFASPEYQQSLHARTLLVTELPSDLRSDEGVVRAIDSVCQTNEMPAPAVARNVKDLPDLIEEYEDAVKELEGYLASYLKNPDKLPAKRPTCKASKKDSRMVGKGQVDAIDYYTTRIKILENEIHRVRETVDKRNAMSYGFASYSSIDSAHQVASAARGKHPKGITVRLAPRPNDILWKNLPLDKKVKRTRRLFNNLWIGLLTLLYIVPNALTAVFLSDLAHLGQVWPAFQRSLEAHQTLWAIVQGILAPAITSLFYFFLPTIFRRLCAHAGDPTKTARERHVMSKLYAFFVFNNLVVFSVFSTVWGFVTAIVAASNKHTDIFEAIKNDHVFSHIMASLCTVSPFWATWLLQRNLGAAIDLSQVTSLAWGSFNRRFRSPTPRQLIEFSAPPPFDYASYYNYFLFYSTVALVFGTIQPLILPITAFYFAFDHFLKKYLLLYVFITKTESGGLFWRAVFNRFLFATFLGNVVIALIVGAQGNRLLMLPAMAPLLLIIGGFKLYCMRAFDNRYSYYSIRPDGERTALPDNKSGRSDRVGVRFGHPALYKPLMTPMVHAKARHLLKDVYRGRIDSVDEGQQGVYLDSMTKSGKTSPNGLGNVEFVSEADMDFENFKSRPDFRDGNGGDGELYGKAEDMRSLASMSRAGTPTGVRPGAQRYRSDSPFHGSPVYGDRSSSRGSDRPLHHDDGFEQGTTYPAGYHQTPQMGRGRAFSPPGMQRVHTSDSQGSGSGRLMLSAAPMGVSTPGLNTPGFPTPGLDTPTNLSDAEAPRQYDYFRGTRNRQ